MLHFQEARRQTAGFDGIRARWWVHAAGPWPSWVGAREVIIGHGHRGDPSNDIDPAAVQAALDGQDRPLPPGSRLVTEVLNVFKRQRAADGTLRFRLWTC